MRYEPHQPLPFGAPLALIIGPPGVGKTTLCYAYSGLLHDFDRGAARAINPGRETEVPGAASEVTFTAEALAPYRGVVIDTARGWLDLLTAEILDAAPKYRTSAGELTTAGWGVLKQRAEAQMTTLQRLDRELLLTAHPKEVRIGDQLKVRPDVQGGSRDLLQRRATLVGRLEQRGGRRFLDFNTTDTFDGKNPGQWPALRVPDAPQLAAFLDELFDDARRALQRLAEESAAIAREVARWKGEVEALRSAEEFTTTFRRLRALKAEQPLVYTQAHHLFDDARRRWAMRWEAAADRFVDGVRSGENHLRSATPRQAELLQERAS
jgi:hypothetical protein